MLFLPSHESVTTEFKREWTDNIKKEIVAFANTLGGDLFIGVDDDGTLVGVDNPDRLEERIISMARDNIHPAVAHLLWFERVRRDGKAALVVHVGQGTDKPYCTDPRDSGTVYVRVGSVTLRASITQIRRFVEESNPTPWDSRIARDQSLTFHYCAAYCAERGLHFNPVQDFTYGLVDPKSRCFTNLAYLLSDQNTYRITLAVFRDEQKTDLKRSKEFSGSILQCLEEANEYILEECLMQMEKPTNGTLERINHYSVPSEAVREALVNMIAHRDYTRTPPCVVHITPSEVKFFSVGGPADLTAHEILTQMATNCRNLRLAHFLKALHLMEGIGSGFQTIRRAYDHVELTELINILDTAFLITLPSKKELPPKKVERRTESEMTHWDDFSPTDERIFDFLSSQSRTSRLDLEKNLSLPRSTTNYHLRKLLEEGRIRKIGVGRNTFYTCETE